MPMLFEPTYDFERQIIPNMLRTLADPLGIRHVTLQGETVRCAQAEEGATRLAVRPYSNASLE